jgi:two-component system, sensor histidine kinase and response regulator
MSSVAPQLEAKTAVGPMPKLRVVQVEDSQPDAELVLRSLRQGGFEVDSLLVQEEGSFIQALRTFCPDVVLSDYNLPGWSGMESLGVLRREGFDIPLILVSGALGDVAAVECIKQGVTDYVLKDGLARLPGAVRRALCEKQLRLDRQRAEANLASKAAELQRSNADLEQFAYVASHDLQEPLRMVTAYTQLLAQRYAGKLGADADQFIGYASDGAQRMQVLIQDLLALSRVGKNSAPRREIDCNVLMADVLRTLSSSVEESGAVVTHSTLPMVNANPTQLAQLFQNLIANAIKFRKETPPAISVKAEGTEKEWRFSVTDNGIGIPPEQLDNVFVIFKRLHTRSEYPGTGIGLAICKKIVEAEGGTIWVESQFGCGSTFNFTLPFFRGPSEQVSPL